MAQIMKNLSRNFLFKGKYTVLTTVQHKYSQVHKSENSSELIVKQLEGKDSGISVMGLNRPKSRNAFSMSLVDKIHRALDDIAIDNSVRVLVVCSAAPGMFGSGYHHYSAKINHNF